MIRLRFAALFLLAAQLVAYAENTKKMSNMDILRNAAVFGMCQEPRDVEDIEQLADTGVDVVVRGISCAWNASPDEARQRMEARRKLAELARRKGILFCTMITGSAIYPKKLPEGKTIEDWCSRDAHGNVIKTRSWHQGCLNNPEFRQYTKDIGRAAIDGGADGIHYDEAYSRWFWMRPIPCFCDCCCRELVEYLRERVPGDELEAKYGIERLDGLRYRDYLAKNGCADEPFRSPLHDQWWLMQLDTTFRYEKEIVDDAKAYAKEKYGKEIVVNSNPYQLCVLNAAMTMETAVYDFVNIGTGLGISVRSGGRPRGLRYAPHLVSYMPQYRMASAHSRGKPVVLFLDIQRTPDTISQLPAEQVDKFMHWLLAEAYASGCFFAAHHTFSNYLGPVESQIRYGQFFKRNRRYTVGTRQVANVAVLYSFPSQIWEAYPCNWNRKSEDAIHSRQYYGVCQAMQDANLQYETLFLGDGEIFDEVPRADLSEYEVMIVPACFSMTDKQLQWLADYAARGAKLVVVPPAANVDGKRRKRTGNTFECSVIDADFEAFLGRQHPDARLKLVETLVEEFGLTPLCDVLDPAANVQLTCRLSRDGAAYIVHVINCQFAFHEGFKTVARFPLELQLPKGFDARKVSARSLSADNGSGPDLTFRSLAPDRVVVTVPASDVHCMLVFE